MSNIDKFYFGIGIFLVVYGIFFTLHYLWINLIIEILGYVYIYASFKNLFYKKNKTGDDKV